MNRRHEVGDADWLEAYDEDKERWKAQLLKAEIAELFAAEKPTTEQERAELIEYAKREVELKATNDAFDREIARRNKEAAWDRACEAVGPYLLGRVQ